MRRSILVLLGLVVQGAEVAALQLSTKIAFATTTNDASAYHFVTLPIGQYEVTAEQQDSNALSKCRNRERRLSKKV